MAASRERDLREGPWLGAALRGRRHREGRHDGGRDRRRGRRGCPMIIVDNLLREREAAGSPIRVGIIGAGFMAQGLVNTIVNSVPGMSVAAIYGRRPERAAHVCEYAGLGPATVVSSQS